VKSRLDPQNSVCCLISQLEHSLNQEITASLHAVGLTILQVQVLAELEKSPGLSTADLARATCVTPQNMSLAVSKLADRDCLVRKPHPTSARIHRLDLTAQGRRVLAKALNRAWAVEHKTFSVLKESDRHRLLESLRKSLVQFKPQVGDDQPSIKTHRYRKPASKRNAARKN
jgi:DNA-binding MarR family transcriptional regulator